MCLKSNLIIIRVTRLGVNIFGTKKLELGQWKTSVDWLIITSGFSTYASPGENNSHVSL